MIVLDLIVEGYRAVHEKRMTVRPSKHSRGRGVHCIHSCRREEFHAPPRETPGSSPAHLRGYPLPPHLTHGLASDQSAPIVLMLTRLERKMVCAEQSTAIIFSGKASTAYDYHLYECREAANLPQRLSFYDGQSRP